MLKLPWETNHPRQASFTGRVVVLIGLGAETVEDSDSESADHLVRIDPLLTPTADGTLVIQAEWQEVLRLPTSGAQSNDHPYLIACRTVPVRWMANKKLFPTPYDLLVATSQYYPGSEYAIADRTPSGAYRLVERALYHPMSGQLPPSDGPEASRRRLATILLLLLALRRLWDSCDLGKGAWIYENWYSAYSTHTSPVILLISYFGLDASGEGTMQEKFDRSADFRAMVAEFAAAVCTSLMRATRTRDRKSVV